MAATIEGEDRVLATAQHIVKSLRTSKDVTDDMLLILSTFDNRLSNISDLIGGGGGEGASLGLSQPDPELSRFESAEDVILHRQSSGSCRRSWEASPDDSCEYLAAIDEVLVLMEDPKFQQNHEAMDRAESAIQTAMVKLEEEFCAVMARNSVPLDPEKLYGSIHRRSLSFSATGNVAGGGIIDDLSNLGEDVDVGNDCYHERGRSVMGDVSVELINPDVISDLRDIAERMIKAGYEKECCQAYSSVRMNILDDFLGTLGVEKLSIEDVQKMEWSSLDELMKRWVQAVKIVVKVLLRTEKNVCEEIFDGHDLIKEICFTETAKGGVIQLLNFGEAVAIGRWTSEKLFRILDMYDALADVLPLLTGLFLDESGSSLCSEARGVLEGLGKVAKTTFAEFEKAVKGEASRKPTQLGDAHPLTRYVMNYLKLLADYNDTLNSLLELDDKQAEDNYQPRERSSDDNWKEKSQLGLRLLSLLDSLEMNLEEKAKVYVDVAMQNIFLMNNKHYIVQKVKGSELVKLLGDDWVRRRRGLIRKYATNYLRSSWTKVLSHLRDEGIGNGGSSGIGKTLLKERFKNFNASFEEVYRLQTAWKVTDPQLSTELRISISEKVIPAYRAFLGRFGSHIEGTRHAWKYLKYNAEDLEVYLADFFEGTPKVIHNVRRKGT